MTVCSYKLYIISYTNYWQCIHGLDFYYLQFIVPRYQPERQKARAWPFQLLVYIAHLKQECKQNKGLLKV